MDLEKLQKDEFTNGAKSKILETGKGNMELLDSFSRGLTTVLQRYDSTITHPQMTVLSGQWLRVSMAMQLPRQINIGHPYGESGWDFLGIANAMLLPLSIDYRLYIGDLRYTRGHVTAANAKYPIDWQRIIIIQNLEELIQNIDTETSIIAMPDGSYRIISTRDDDLFISKQSLLSVIDELIQLPLGPVILQINGLSDPIPQELPWDTLQYCGWTFERGEEPTEIEGNQRFSTVSGWKAYARWMQSYQFDNSSAIHPFIKSIPHLLIDRRKAASEYWFTLASQLQIEQSASIAEQFGQIAEDAIPLFETLIDSYKDNENHRTIRKNISACYFNEQRTLHVFNQAKKHYNDLAHRKKPW